MSRKEQTRMFKRNAHIRQKIYAAVFCLAVIGFYAWCMSYDPIQIWHGVILVPLVLVGLYYLITPVNYLWAAEKERETRQ